MNYIKVKNKKQEKNKKGSKYGNKSLFVGKDKLIYVHEGKVRESLKRNYLKNKCIFASNQKKSDNLWIDAYDYLDRTYNLDKIKQIFILGDGARWKTFLEWIDRAMYTLDSFYLNKAILIASGRKNNKDDYEY